MKEMWSKRDSPLNWMERLFIEIIVRAKIGMKT
jgi:hypothetical protein